MRHPIYRHAGPSLRYDIHAQALSLTAALETNQIATAEAQDISWFWRTAYNTAVQGCSGWEGHEDTVSDLFDISRQVSRHKLAAPRPPRGGDKHRLQNSHALIFQFLEIYVKLPAVESDAELHVFLVNASFAGVSGKGKQDPKKLLGS